MVKIRVGSILTVSVVWYRLRFNVLYYKFIFLYVIPAFFLFGFIYTIWNKDPFSLLGLIFILYYTIVCVFLSYQDTAFNRLRVGIDPVLMSFFVICFRRLKWINISNDNLNN